MDAAGDFSRIAFVTVHGVEYLIATSVGRSSKQQSPYFGLKLARRSSEEADRLDLGLHWLTYPFPRCFERGLDLVDIMSVYAEGRMPFDGRRQFFWLDGAEFTVEGDRAFDRSKVRQRISVHARCVVSRNPLRYASLAADHTIFDGSQVVFAELVARFGELVEDLAIAVDPAVPEALKKHNEPSLHPPIFRPRIWNKWLLHLLDKFEP